MPPHDPWNGLPEFLYHYCSNESFVKIVTTKSIWLSSLNQSNDSAEGRLGLEYLLRLSMHEPLHPWQKEILLREFFLKCDHCDGLAFCLSEEKDSLPQWRGYADDGRGVAIGFGRPYLSEVLAHKVSQLNKLAGDMEIPLHQRVLQALRKVEYGTDKLRERLAVC